MGANGSNGWKADICSVGDDTTGATYFQSVSLLKKRDRPTSPTPTDIFPGRLHIAHCAVWQSNSQDREIAPSDACCWMRSHAQHFCLNLVPIGNWHAELEI